MKEYIKAEIEIIRIEEKDIVTESGCDTELPPFCIQVSE